MTIDLNTRIHKAFSEGAARRAQKLSGMFDDEMILTLGDLVQLTPPQVKALLKNRVNPEQCYTNLCDALAQVGLRLKVEHSKCQET